MFEWKMSSLSRRFTRPHTSMPKPNWPNGAVHHQCGTLCGSTTVGGGGRVGTRPRYGGGGGSVRGQGIAQKQV